MAGQPTTVELVRVLIASPGDVPAERGAARKLVAEMHEEWVDRGFSLMSQGWEDVSAAGGAPQDNINPLVDTASVFVGVLSAHWGFPTERYSSGFEEEFERALDLYKSSELRMPELCVFFTRRPPRGDPQLGDVERFRHRLEKTRDAYYRDYDSIEEFVGLVRSSITRYLNRRLDQRQSSELLARTEEPPVEATAADWRAVLDEGAFARLPDGAQRRKDAAELGATQPREAAGRLAQLADDVEAADPQLLSGAEELRLEAARLLHDADDQDAATRMLLSVVRSRAARSTALTTDASEVLSEWYGDAGRPIERAWAAVVEWPEHPGRAVQDIAGALAAPRWLSANDQEFLRERMVEMLLWTGQLDDAGRAVGELGELADDSSDERLGLGCLRAEWLELAGAVGAADREWDVLVRWADEHGDERPATAGAIYARHACHRARTGLLGAAQRGFQQAAARWSAVEGAAGEVAEQRFSSYSAANLLGDHSGGFDRNRPLTVAVRDAVPTPTEAAERLLRAGLDQRVTGEAYYALTRLTLATVTHRRAGHLRGESYGRHLLMELYEHVGEPADALEQALLVGRGRDAKRLARRLPGNQLLHAVACRHQSPWARRASLVALASGGSALRGEQLGELAGEVLRMAEQPVLDLPSRDEQRAAVEALAELFLEWPEASRAQAERVLTVAATSDNLLVAPATARALLSATDVERGDYTDVLGSALLNQDRGRVSAQWLAQQLPDRPALRARLTAAASTGDFNAMEALASDESRPLVPRVQEQVQATLSARLNENRPLGRTRDGAFVGFLAVEPWGILANRVHDAEVRAAWLEALIALAQRDEDPHINRASAVNALFNMVEALDSDQRAALLDVLEPLAHGQFGKSVFDVAPKVAKHPFNRFRMGDDDAAGRLQGAAIRASARICDADHLPAPAWLGDRVEDALLADDDSLAELALLAIAGLPSLPGADMARGLLLADNAGIRQAALVVLRRRGLNLRPEALARRLAEDSSPNVRLALLELLTSDGSYPAVVDELAQGDPDSYVRAIAARLQHKAGSASP